MNSGEPGDDDDLSDLDPEQRRRREEERRRRRRREEDSGDSRWDALEAADNASTGGCSLPGTSWIGRGSRGGGGDGWSSSGSGGGSGGGSGCGSSGGSRGGGGCDGCDCNLTLMHLLRVSTLLLVASRMLPDAGTRPLVRAVIRGYQRRLTRFTPRCPSTPSCSAYALAAVEALGPRRGLAAAARRVAGCGQPPRR